MTSKQDLDKLKDRLAKILALADPSRNPSPEEAQAAMDKALALAREHNIELSSINSKEYKSSAAIQTSVTCDMRHLPPEVANVIGTIMEQCLKVRVLLSGDYNAQREVEIAGYHVFGAIEDVTLVKGLWDFVLQTLVDSWALFLDTREICYGDGIAMNRRSVHISFCQAFAQGCIDRNKASEPEQVSENYGLVLRNKEAAADELMHRLFPNTVTKMRSRRYVQNETATIAGYAAGEKISLVNQLTHH